MKKLLLIGLLTFLIFSLHANKYNVTITNDGSFYRIDGTNYYLDIFLYIGIPLREQAVLNTSTNQIHIYNRLRKEYESYQISKIYEKVDLPFGTVNEYGLLVRTVFIPTTIK